MDPVTAIANAVGEVFKFLNTPAGQRIVERSIERSEEAEKHLKAFGAWIEDLFQGKLIKP